MDNLRVWGQKYALGLFFGLALALRLAFARIPFLEVDSTAFLATARYWLGQGGVFQGAFYWPPLFPLMAALLAKTGLQLETALSLIPAFCGALLVFPLYLLGRDLFGEWGGKWAALFTAVYPQLVYFSGLRRTEGLYLLCFFWGVYYLYRSLYSGDKRAAQLSGGWWALAYLSRFEGFSGFLLGGLWLLAGAVQGKSRESWLKLGGFILAFGVIALPYQVFLAKNHSFILPRSKLLYDTLESNYVAQGGAYPNLVFSFGLPGEKGFNELRYLADQLPQLSEKFTGRFYLKSLPEVGKGILAVCWPVLLVLGILGFKEWKGRRDVWYWLSLPLLALPVSLGGFWDTNPRYYLFLAPLLIIFALPGWLALLESRDKAYFLPVWCALALSLLPGLPSPLYPSWFYYKNWTFSLLILALLASGFYLAKKLKRRELLLLLRLGFLAVGLENLGVFYGEMSRYAQTTNFVKYVPAGSGSLMGENSWNAYYAGRQWVKIPTAMEFGDFRAYVYRQKPGLMLDARYVERPLSYPFYTDHLKQLLRRKEIRLVKSCRIGSGRAVILVDFYTPAFPPGPLKQVS